MEFEVFKKLTSRFPKLHEKTYYLIILLNNYRDIFNIHTSKLKLKYPFFALVKFFFLWQCISFLGTVFLILAPYFDKMHFSHAANQIRDLLLLHY